MCKKKIKQKLDLSAEVDRRRSELRESNELSHYEIVEAKQKNDEELAVRKQLDDELKIELSA